MAKRGEHFKAEFKFKVVLELLKEESSLAEIASKYNVTSKSITAWKNEFIENGVSVFNKNKELKSHKNELDEKESYIEKLHGKVGQLTLEVDWLNKVIRDGFTMQEQKTMIAVSYTHLTLPTKA